MVSLDGDVGLPREGACDLTWQVYHMMSTWELQLVTCEMAEKRLHRGWEGPDLHPLCSRR